MVRVTELASVSPAPKTGVLLLKLHSEVLVDYVGLAPTTIPL